MKKLNKQQKQLLKKSLLKGVNITCYIIAGLSLALGVIVGVKSCSDKKKVNVTTTPVVSDVVSRHDMVNNSIIGYSTTYEEFQNFYYLDDYFNGKSYIADDTNYVGVSYDTYNVYYPSWTYNKYLLRCRNLSNANVKTFHISGTFDDGNGLDLSFDNDGYSIQYLNSTTIKINLTNGNGYALDFSRGSQDGRYSFTLTFADLNTYMNSSAYKVDIVQGLDVMLNAMGVVYNRPSENVQRSYYLGQYLLPYAPIGFDSPSTPYIEYLGDTSSFWNDYQPFWRKVFDGSFTSNGQRFDKIYVQYITYPYPNNTTYPWLVFRQLMYANTLTNYNVSVWSSNVDELLNDAYQVISPANFRFWCNNTSYQSIYVESVITEPTRLLRTDNGYLTTLSSMFTSDEIPTNQGDNNNFDNIGVDDGEIINAWNSMFGLLGATFNSLGGFFNISIMGVTLGTFLFIPFVVSTIIFVVWLFKR